MKIRILVSTLLFAVAVAPSIQAADEPKTPLAEQMEKMDTSRKALGRGGANLADATKNTVSLAEIAKIRAHAVESMKFEPKTKEEKPAAEQAKFVTDYQAKMKELIAELDKITELLKAGKNEDAAKQYAAIAAIQKDGHNMFRKSAKKQ